jgi:hypothetical protein
MFRQRAVFERIPALFGASLNPNEPFKMACGNARLHFGKVSWLLWCDDGKPFWGTRVCRKRELERDRFRRRVWGQTNGKRGRKWRRYVGVGLNGRRKRTSWQETKTGTQGILYFRNLLRTVSLDIGYLSSFLTVFWNEAIMGYCLTLCLCSSLYLWKQVNSWSMINYTGNETGKFIEALAQENVP